MRVRFVPICAAFVVVVAAAAAVGQARVMKPLTAVTSSDTWEYRLHLDGVEGEETGGYAGWISATGFQQMIQRPMGPGGRATGGPTVSPVTVYKHIDNASPALYNRCLTGVSIPNAVIVMNPRSNPANTMRLEMTNVTIASVETTSSQSGEPVEIIKLAAQSILWRYRAGASGDAESSEWRAGRD